MSKIKIGFLSEYSPDDRKASSGTNFKIAQSLKPYGNIEWIQVKKRRFGRYAQLISRCLFKTFGRNFDLQHTFWGSKLIYKQLDIDLLEKYDIICAFFCMQNIYDISLHTPIIYFTDATFKAIVDYYPWYTNLPHFNIEQGTFMEIKACQNSKAIVFASDWAANSAKYDLNIDPLKVNVIEYGANIDDDDIQIPQQESDKSLKLLFIGVDWIRKGGNIAADTAIWLNNVGVKAILNIVGVHDIPPKYINEKNIKVWGFLNKNKIDDYKLLTKLIREADCLILPTSAECAGIVFAEASAHGIPVFTYNTGGVGNYVLDGVNGYKLPVGASGEEFGAKILNCQISGELLRMKDRSIELYQQKLNWRVWGEKVGALIKKLI